jgi:hypothetical protein
MRKYIKGIVILIGSVALILWFGYKSTLNRLNRFKNEPNCFTKTISIKLSTTADGYPTVDYKIYVKNKIYEGFHMLNEKDRFKIRDTMTVKYLCNEPDMSELIIDE